MFTYTGTPLTRTLDAIRIELGDTIERQHLMEDEDLLYFYEQEGTVLKAAARACEALAARFAPQDSFRGGTFTIQKASVSAKYLMMAKAFRQKSINAGSFIVPSISVADKEANETDSTVVQPAFTRGMHDNEDTGPDTGLD